MTEETIQQIEHGNVRYLIWSNRLFPEYEVLRWGIDFDKPLGDYLLSHYRLVGPLMPGKVRFGEWTAFIWERKPEVESRGLPLDKTEMERKTGARRPSKK